MSSLSLSSLFCVSACRVFHTTRGYTKLNYFFALFSCAECSLTRVFVFEDDWENDEGRRCRRLKYTSSYSCFFFALLLFQKRVCLFWKRTSTVSRRTHRRYDPCLSTMPSAVSGRNEAWSFGRVGGFGGACKTGTGGDSGGTLNKKTKVRKKGPEKSHRWHSWKRRALGTRLRTCLLWRVSLCCRKLRRLLCIVNCLSDQKDTH